MHAQEDPSSHGEDRSDRAGRDSQSRRGRPSAQELKRLRLKEMLAYVSVDDLSGLQQEAPEPEEEVSSEAERKRTQRKKDEDAGFHYFNVKMPIKDPALKETVKMVAATLIEDREFHHTVNALVSDPAVREIVDCAASSSGDAALIAKAARTGSLLQLASVAAADGELTQRLVQLADDRTLLKAIGTIATALIGDREFHRTLVALVSNPPLRETIDCTSLEPGDMALIAKAARTGGLLHMARVADANGELTECLDKLADDATVLNAINTVAVALVADREFHRTLAVLASNPSLRETVDCAASAPDDATLIAKAARSGGLLQLAKVADANGELVQCLAQMVGDGVFLEAVSVLVRNFSEMNANSSSERPLEAAAAALRAPAATLRFSDVRERGGIRAQILDWILGLS